MDSYLRQYKDGLAKSSNPEFRNGRSSTQQGSMHSQQVSKNNISLGVRDSFVSDSSLEGAEIRHATRVPISQGHVPVQSTLPRNQPFYSQVIQPQMQLGDKWQGAFSQSKNRPSMGFEYVEQGLRFVPLVAGPKVHDPKTKKLLHSATVYLEETYRRCNPEFSYKPKNNPQRVLTKPNKPAKNDGYDNEDCDYILKVNEILGEEKGCQFRVIDLLGKGTFGQVVKCEQLSTGKQFSVKVIKNKPAYRRQSLMEVEILKQLNDKLDPENKHHIVRMNRMFYHKNHLCLVFELLSYNLYELLKQNKHKGLSIHMVRQLALQLLDTLALLKKGKIIHCDLKPENILLTNTVSPVVKVIDFGSACHEANRMYTYIQSRFYRSPEVLLGLPYTCAIDMWSLGCIVAEMTIGLPLFPGSSEFEQLHRIVDMMGTPPHNMLNKKESDVDDFFVAKAAAHGETVYELKVGDQYGGDRQRNGGFRRYFHGKTLSEVIRFSRKPRDQQRGFRDAESEERIKALIDFLERLLELDPLRRWTPQEALQHPFITGKPFDESQPCLSPSMQPEVTGSHRSSRARAQSMNAPSMPKQMLALVQNMKESPIVENHPAPVSSKSTTQKGPRIPQSRSQGNLVGFYQENAAPAATAVAYLDRSERKVRIAPKVKVCYGSHESYKSTNEDRKTANPNMNSMNAGEAAGGIMMMAQTSGKMPVWTMMEETNRRGRRK